MNSERWKEITRSFGLTGLEVETVGTQEESITPIDSVQIITPPLLEEYDTCMNQSPSKFNMCSNKERENTPMYYKDEDASGKVIENLCKILQEKTEKVKKQEQTMYFLHTNKSFQPPTKENSAQTDECQKEVRGFDHENDITSSIKLILEKVEDLETRLNTVVDFICKKFPQATLSNSGAPSMHKREHGNNGPINYVSRSWAKSPVIHPKPTCGSLLREMHCRCRQNQNCELQPLPSNNISEKESVRRHASFHAPVSRPRENVELRLQTLEKLIVVLKDRIMKKINFRIKRHRN